MLLTMPSGGFNFDIGVMFEACVHQIPSRYKPSEWMRDEDSPALPVNEVPAGEVPHSQLIWALHMHERTHL